MIVAQITVYIAMATLVAVAWNDVRELKIRNFTVIVLILLYVIHILFMRLHGLPGDLMAGILLFLIGLGMWLVGGMGAGDAKLMFVIGLFTGYFALPIFAILLLLVSIVLFMLILIAAKTGRTTGVLGRLARMRREGHVPYAVPLVIAALPSMLLGLYGPS